MLGRLKRNCRGWLLKKSPGDALLSSARLDYPHGWQSQCTDFVLLRSSSVLWLCHLFGSKEVASGLIRGITGTAPRAVSADAGIVPSRPHAAKGID